MIAQKMLYRGIFDFQANRLWDSDLNGEQIESTFQRVEGK
jgi:hypothetical protein